MSTVKDKRLYDVLEIPPNASEVDIKKAYKTLSKKWHPDKNRDNLEESTKKFQEIAEANAILSDPEKRKTYDLHGTVSDTPDFDPSNFGNFGGFSEMFGGAGGHFFGKKQSRSEDCIVEHSVTLEELFNNKLVNVKYKQKIHCTACNGSGSKDGRSNECTGCNGQGHKMKVIRQGPMIQQMVVQCDECGGSGEKVSKSNACDVCNGMKYTTRDAVFELQLNRSMPNNSKLMVEHMGHQFKNQKTNLIIVVREQPHSVFKRYGRDLHVDIKLRLYQSLYGFSKTLTHLDGRYILLKYDTMLSQMNTTMVVRKEGMGGDLIVHITTMMPKLDKLDENENNILKKVLTKIHLSEYQKEQNILKNTDKMTQVHMEEVEHEPQHEPQRQEQHEQHEEQGVQCGQQ